MSVYSIEKGRHFRASIPMIRKEDGYLCERFKTENEAKVWKNRTGVEMWGYRRWFMILNGLTHRMRSKIFGISVRQSYSRLVSSTGLVYEYPCFRVEWREDGVGKAKQFSYSKYGDCKVTAEHHANLFAAHQRAKHTGGELHLPLFQFELNVGGRISDTKKPSK